MDKINQLAHLFCLEMVSIPLFLRSKETSFIPLSHTPFLNHWFWNLLFGLYSGILLSTFMYQANSFKNGVSGISPTFVLIGTAILALASRLLTTGAKEPSLFGLGFRPIGISAIYIAFIGFGLFVKELSIVYECDQCNNGPLFVAVTAQAAMLGIVFGVYSRPSIPETLSRKEDYELHLDNWWRMTQAIISLIIALGIGILAQFLISSENLYLGQLVPLILGLGVGLIAIVIFIFRKMFIIERAVRE